MIRPYKRTITINQIDTNHIKKTYDFVLLEDLEKEEEIVEYDFTEVAPIKITVVYTLLRPYEYAIEDVMNYPDKKMSKKYFEDLEKGKKEINKQNKWFYIW